MSTQQLTIPGMIAAPRKLTWEERFEEFHERNPWVYLELLNRSRELRAIGFKQYSLRTLWESLRWKKDLQAVGGETFKLNNNLAPFYARKLMRENPSLRGFFELRERAK